MQFKTTPLSHQATELETNGLDLARGIFWEQGLGKTKLIIDEAAMAYRAGLIDCLIVVAPPGVHRNWVTDEIPLHMPDDIDTHAFFYESGKAGTKWHQAQCLAALKHPGLLVVCFSYNGFMTKRSNTWMGGMHYARRLLDKRRCMMALDEAHNIKAPGAKRTISIVAAGKYAASRRILTGTPVANSPLDIYKPMQFLENSFWDRHGFESWVAFKTYFGIWEKRTTSTDQEYEHCVGYRNLDQLAEIISPLTSRILKEDVLDLPEKMYQFRYFEMAPDQARAYKDLSTELIAMFESGDIVTVNLAITKMLRLQQITCGYVPTDPTVENPDATTWHDFPKNPRLDTCAEVCEETPHQGIIWARFRRDIDKICDMLGREATRYDGTVDESQRARNKAAFLGGEKKWIVASDAMSTGHTLVCAKTAIFYSNSFKLVDRLQMEDRMHRIGQTASTLYVDLCAPGTIDEKIVRAFRQKRQLSDSVLKDPPRTWL